RATTQARAHEDERGKVVGAGERLGGERSVVAIVRGAAGRVGGVVAMVEGGTGAAKSARAAATLARTRPSSSTRCAREGGARGRGGPVLDGGNRPGRRDHHRTGEDPRCAWLRCPVAPRHRSRAWRATVIPCSRSRSRTIAAGIVERFARPGRAFAQATTMDDRLLPPPLLNTRCVKTPSGCTCALQLCPRRRPRATRGRLRPPRWTSTRTFVASLMRPASALTPTA